MSKLFMHYIVLSSSDAKRGNDEPAEEQVWISWKEHPSNNNEVQKAIWKY